MSVKQELHELIDRLSEQDAGEALDILQSFLAEPETLSADEIARVKVGEKQIASGDFVSLDALRRDPSR